MKNVKLFSPLFIDFLKSPTTAQTERPEASSGWQASHPIFRKKNHIIFHRKHLMQKNVSNLSVKSVF